VSEWLLLNANSVIFQLYHGEYKLIFNEMMTRSTSTNKTERYDIAEILLEVVLNTLSLFTCLSMYAVNIPLKFSLVTNKGQTRDYKIIICCFSAKHAALRRKSKDWLAHNQNNVSGWSNMSTRGLFNFSAISWRVQVNFQWDDDEVHFVLNQHTELAQETTVRG
jgi:hypothetical protein